MKILKFGGTSIGSAQMMHKVADIISDTAPKMVVLSAMKDTTDKLEEIAHYLYQNNNEGAHEQINKLERKYAGVIDELFRTDAYKEKGKALVASHFEYIRSFTQKAFTLLQEKGVLAQGELISTALFHYCLAEKGIASALLPALNFMRIDKSEEPDYFYIKENMNRELEKCSNKNLFITQGYICRNAYGEIDNLKRGGSDYTASILGAVLEAEEIQIWTDVNGIRNNDPRLVEKTKSIDKLSFDEAAELAYFGASILHPSSVQPAKNASIPVRLKNTMQPDNTGTLITNETIGDEIKAIAAKDGITSIKIKSGRMLMAYGFLRKVFEIFEIYKTPIDMITTSEIAVSVTVDQSTYLKEVINELKKFGTVETESGLTIVCIVGNLIAEKKGIAAKVFNALKDIPLQMISYGGSNHNISILINTEHKKETLNTLNSKLF